MDVSTNPLVVAEREARSPTGRPGALLFFFAVNVVFKLCFGLVLALLGGMKEPGQIVLFREQLEQTVNFLPDIVLLAGWLWLKEKRPFSSVGLREPGRGLLRFALGLLTGCLSMALLAGIIALLGGFHRGTPLPGMHVGIGALGSALVLLGGFVIQGSSEEIYTRGYLLPIGINRGSLAGGIALQALAFMVVHLLNGHIAFLPLLNLVLVAVFLALVALKEGSLWLVCGWHAGWNWCQSNVFGIPVSGIQVGNSLLFLQPSPRSPGALTGGLFGVEGSALTTLFLLVGSALAYLSLRRTSQES